MSGTPSWLPPQGYFGLMFLKHYTKLSDEKLLERFNTDWAIQMFCGALLSDNEMIIHLYQVYEDFLVDALILKSSSVK